MDGKIDLVSSNLSFEESIMKSLNCIDPIFGRCFFGNSEENDVNILEYWKLSASVTFSAAVGDVLKFKLYDSMDHSSWNSYYISESKFKFVHVWCHIMCSEYDLLRCARIWVIKTTRSSTSEYFANKNKIQKWTLI